MCALLLASAGLTACSSFSSNKSRVPDTTMTKVLVELHLANARRSHVGSLPDGLKDSVFARHDVQRSDFEATLRHYTRNPKAFDALYNTVIDTLKAIESRLRQNPYDDAPQPPPDRGSSSAPSK